MTGAIYNTEVVHEYNPVHFAHVLNHTLDRYTEDGLDVEIRYQVVPHPSGDILYTALVIARHKE